MKKICFITAARSEYGLLKYLMQEVDRSEQFQLQVIVTGAHLMKEQGHTIDAILKDGIRVDQVIDAQIDTNSPASIAESMGRLAQLFPRAFAKLTPDYIIVLGDRYELLPICNTAYMMGIPIVHIAGGDVTEGALDNGIRNAVTMLASYHFPGTKDSAENVIRMRGSANHVWCVGETNMDAFRLETKISRTALANDLKIDSKKTWILFTYHAETKQSLEYNLSAVRNCMDALLSLDLIQIIATYSNADYGGSAINEYLELLQKSHPDTLRVIPSLGNKRYLSLMQEVKFVIGNSSSGIEESPAAGVAAINIGSRQQGRHLCSNITQCDGIDTTSIRRAVQTCMEQPVDLSEVKYWGDGYASQRICSILEGQLA